MNNALDHTWRLLPSISDNSDSLLSINSPNSSSDCSLAFEEPYSHLLGLEEVAPTNAYANTHSFEFCDSSFVQRPPLNHTVNDFLPPPPTLSSSVPSAGSNYNGMLGHHNINSNSSSIGKHSGENGLDMTLQSLTLTQPVSIGPPGLSGHIKTDTNHFYPPLPDGHHRPDSIMFGSTPAVQAVESFRNLLGNNESNHHLDSIKNQGMFKPFDHSHIMDSPHDSGFSKDGYYSNSANSGFMHNNMLYPLPTIVEQQKLYDYGDSRPYGRRSMTISHHGPPPDFKSVISGEDMVDQNLITTNVPKKISRRRSIGAFDNKANSGGRSSTENVFICPHPDCNKTFSRFYNLKSHQRTHTGEKPFVCDHPGCNARFGRNHDLKRHRRVHTGDRPYKCETCGKTFSRLDALNRHIKVNVNSSDHGFTKNEA